MLLLCGAGNRRGPGPEPGQHAKRAMDQLLKSLGAREREVLELYFGLRHGESANLPQMARLLGVSKERVRQIKDKALAKLKALLLMASNYPCLPIGH